MIAIEVSAAAGSPPFGGVGTLVRSQVSALLRLDPETRYVLCHKPSRWRGRQRFRPSLPNVVHRPLQDPLNALLIPGVRLLHSMSSYLPRTPRVTKLVNVVDINHLRNPEWVTPQRLERRRASLHQMVSRADHVVTQSRYTTEDVRDYFGLAADRVHTISAGVDAHAFAPPSADEIARTRAEYGDYAMAIGLLTSRKNFPRLVAAVSRVRGLRLIVVGSRAHGVEDFFDSLDRYGMRDRVQHLEAVPHDDLVRLVGAARVFAVSSLFEGFGLIALEAMACGTPVVCSDATSLPEVVGEAGLLVDASSIDEIEAAIRRVLDDSELAESLRERGLDRARKMSWEASAAALLALYRRLA